MQLVVLDVESWQKRMEIVWSDGKKWESLHANNCEFGDNDKKWNGYESINALRLPPHNLFAMNSNRRRSKMRKNEEIVQILELIANFS